MSNRHSYERYEIPDIKGRKHAVVLFSENRSEVRNGIPSTTMGFDNFDGCISTFTPRVCTYVKIYNSYRFAKLKYLEVIKHE